MSCIITYKGNKYTQEQFKEYISSNKNEFSHIIASNEKVIDSFKRKMEDIDYVFSQSPELASIGSKAQYLQYLSTIFKTSKVKDIVYHGSNSKEKYEKPITRRSGWDDGYYVTRDKEYAKVFSWGGHLVLALINVKNPTYPSQKIIAGNLKLDKDSDSIIGIEMGGENESIVLFEPEQIHILGSKQDMKGFKDFVQGKQFQKLTAEEKAKTIEQVTKEHRSITALKDLSAKLAHRIGGKIEFENKTGVDWKGYNQGMTSVLNEAYMTPDTPFHEILAHPIIRAIKTRTNYYKTGETAEFHGYGEPYRVTIEKIYDDTLEADIIDEKGNKQKVDLFELSKTQNTLLYQSLLKELETGRGKEVFEQVKRDYNIKKQATEKNNDYEYEGYIYTQRGSDFNRYNKSTGVFEKTTEEKHLEALNYYYDTNKVKYTLEEQQEEAIVTLLGLMASDKLDAKQDATLISKLKELWKQISDFVKSLLRQDGIKIDELPITTTLNDLAEIMAYGNNKIILPGYKVEYSTPLGNKYDTLEEVNNEIRELAEANIEVDLSGVKIDTSMPDKFELEVDMGSDEPSNILKFTKENGQWYISDNWTGKSKIDEGEVIKYYKDVVGSYFGAKQHNISSFIEKNKEYEQSKEIIEQWKKENNIKYDPEEVYSRGQGFYSSIGAYSNLELDLLLKNLIQHIEDNKKAGGEFTISAFTKPIGSRLKHLEGTGDRVRFVIYPKSEHIKWATPTDVFSGSVWDASEKVSKDKKSELLGVSFTKAPALRNINEVSPNLADIIDNLTHVHNELGIELTTNNFRIEYDDNIEYSTKKLIDNINKILDDKYGKLGKPEIKREGSKIETYGPSDDGSYMYVVRDSNNEVVTDFETYQEAENYVRQNITKQPTQTRENTISIESIKDKLYNENYNNQLKNYESAQQGIIPEYYSAYTNLNGELSRKVNVFALNLGKTKNEVGMWQKDEDYDIVKDFIVGEDENKHGVKFWVLSNRFKKEALNSYKDPHKGINQEKEYTSQAEINLKMAALKETARKYPRSLITSKVVPINPNIVDNSEIQYSKVGSKQDIEGFKESMSNKSSQVENMVDGVPNINDEEKSLKLALKGLTPEEKISFCNHFGITMTEENGKKC